MAVREYTADEVVQMLNRTPLFMTSLDESDGAGGENIELEALKALAYEGSRADVAANFREQGNENARVRRWGVARGFYEQALGALRQERREGELVDEEGNLRSVEEEEKRERVLEEACWVNKALCELELRNYRACNLACAATLRLNPTNVKAWFRSASACLALDKIPEAADACARGLEIDKANAALLALEKKINARAHYLGAQMSAQRAREEKKRRKGATLAAALGKRGIVTRVTDKAPDTQDAEVALEDEGDEDSLLKVPVIFLYPLEAQSDFVKGVGEDESLFGHLEYVLPVPWDGEGEYGLEGVECYAETAAGGLVKVGRKVTLGKLLGGGRVEVVDGLVTVFVVPAAKAKGWIEEFKRRKGRG
ncbi:TPR repeat protein-like protein [Trichodelitschia bisporula]|uniref:TPR repeat protein-like protein n=1 Tax=Trichodelitschia bisporula TaxID=703511 RepID=A0A6G1I2Q7_9PEZI|nr:TPR repeat protein-like protein [Trichodelitschia bisporula]